MSIEAQILRDVLEIQWDSIGLNVSLVMVEPFQTSSSPLVLIRLDDGMEELFVAAYIIS